MIGLMLGWIFPFYCYIGIFTLLYALWKDKDLSGFTWKNAALITILWPVVWFVVILFKTSD